jgi:hypothetical protein
MIHQIWMADTRKAATTAFDAFLGTHRAKYPDACECLKKNRTEFLAFYNFPQRLEAPPRRDPRSPLQDGLRLSAAATREPITAREEATQGAVGHSPADALNNGQDCSCRVCC